MIKVFIADFLPLKNKGEEAILRGIETLYKKKYNEEVCFFVFDNVYEKQIVGNVTILPRNMVYPDFKGKKTNGYIGVLYSVLWNICYLLGFYLPITRKRNRAELLSTLNKCDKVIIGHDGFYNPFCAAFTILLKRRSIKYGILGAGFNRPSRHFSFVFDYFYRQSFDNADYVVLREKTAYDYVLSISNNPKVFLQPDMAFFAESDFQTLPAVQQYIVETDNKLKIGVTLCENSISFSSAFIHASNKSKEHRAFIAQLFDDIINKYDCVFYFLPHSIEKQNSSDLAIAYDVKNQMKQPDRLIIIEKDYPVKAIKYTISQMDFLIGERTHSIINSICVRTPFVNLTCSADFRSHDIIGDYCGLPSCIVDLDNPEDSVVSETIFSCIDNRKNIKEKLECIMSLINDKSDSILALL